MTVSFKIPVREPDKQYGHKKPLLLYDRGKVNKEREISQPVKDFFTLFPNPFPLLAWGWKTGEGIMGQTATLKAVRVLSIKKA
jgi:hypothetical protein